MTMRCREHGTHPSACFQEHVSSGSGSESPEDMQARIGREHAQKTGPSRLVWKACPVCGVVEGCEVVGGVVALRHLCFTRDVLGPVKEYGTVPVPELSPEEREAATRDRDAAVRLWAEGSARASSLQPMPDPYGQNGNGKGSTK